MADRTPPSSGTRTPPSTISAPARALAPSPLMRAVDRWIGDGRAQGWSKRTLHDHYQNLERFCWWLVNEEEVSPTLDALSPARVRSFLAYLRQPAPGGRFGSAAPHVKREARPSTVFTYYRDLRAFVNFLLAEGLVEENPMRNVRAPRVPADQIQPLEPEQVQALVDAARRGRAAERDVALVMLLVDTGMRVSELCGLTVGDVDRGTGELMVTGKGNKRRRVYMGLACRRALWRYLEAERRQALSDEPLFVSIGGNTVGAGLTRAGVGHILKDLARAAGIVGVRCSPHSLRHTFAISFLRSGGNVLELQQLLGHTDLAMVRRYVALAEADLSRAHRQASPADRMRLK